MPKSIELDDSHSSTKNQEGRHCKSQCETTMMVALREAVGSPHSSVDDYIYQARRLVMSAPTDQPPIIYARLSSSLASVALATLTRRNSSFSCALPRTSLPRRLVSTLSRGRSTSASRPNRGLPRDKGEAPCRWSFGKAHSYSLR